MSSFPPPRSLLFVPGDRTERFDKALAAGSDAVIIDLEDAVAPSRKEEARANTADFLARRENRPCPVMVRVNAVESLHIEADLDAAMPHRPDAIVLPKPRHGADVTQLDVMLRVHEATHGRADGETPIYLVACEDAAALFQMGTMQGASPRLRGISWGAEDFSASLGIGENRTPAGGYTEPLRVARAFVLFSASAAGAEAIDAVYPDFRDPAGLEREAREAARDGFSGKLAIHPAQVAIINAAFTPTDAEIANARAVVAAFEEADARGAVALEGKMLDLPHLVHARRLLARARME